MKNTSKIEFWRLLVQSLSLLIFVWLVSTLSYPLEWEGPLLLWVSRVDPWLLLSQLRWQAAIPVWAWLPLLTLLTSLVWGRIFCGWLCPLGSLLSWTDKLGGALFKKARSKKTLVLNGLFSYRYYWLGLLIVVFGLGSNWVLFFTPFNLFSHEIVRMMRGSLPWMMLAIILVTLFFSRIWCSALCPTGMLLSLAARARFYRFAANDTCIRCGKCEESCSVGAISAAPGVTRESCMVCGTCKDICPVKAVEWEWHHHHQEPQTNRDIADTVPKDRIFSRRQFALLTATLCLAALIWKQVAQASTRVLRPPGALDEAEFNLVCSHCGRCIQVCPNQALWPMTIETGLSNLETPEFIPRKGRCDLCMACQEVCPTGAIALVPAEQVRIGKSRIDRLRCLAWSEHKLCFLCGEQCPFQAIIGDELVRPTVIIEKCVGCGACENGCPVAGEAAIRVFPA